MITLSPLARVALLLAARRAPARHARRFRGYTRLGNFFYGGSLNILLFSKGLASGAIQTRLGNQITLFNVGTAPAAD